MPNWIGRRRIAIVTACMNGNGSPEFVLNEVVVTQDEAENGIHYYLAESELLIAGYEEPFVHFDQDEAPAFLHPAVRKHLGLSPASTDLSPSVRMEESSCPA